MPYTDNYAPFSFCSFPICRNIQKAIFLLPESTQNTHVHPDRTLHYRQNRLTDDSDIYKNAVLNNRRRYVQNHWHQ